MVLIPSSDSVAGTGVGSGTDLGGFFGRLLGLESNRVLVSLGATGVIALS
jgi:hypothetical protein